MQTKLTLRLDEDLIKFAKKEAQREGKSLSQMVADYLKAIKSKHNAKKNTKEEFSPFVKSLMGAMKIDHIDKEDYYRYLEEKYK